MVKILSIIKMEIKFLTPFVIENFQAEIKRDPPMIGIKKGRNAIYAGIALAALAIFASLISLSEGVIGLGLFSIGLIILGGTTLHKHTISLSKWERVRNTFEEYRLEHPHTSTRPPTAP